AARLVSSIDQADLRDRLSRFSALESFGLEGSERWIAMKGVPLPQVHEWRQACPNLRHFSFFGTDIFSK
ncbi:hypothetical protein FS749_014406, partial [Ceratobasidium sp. UAMH 11750]